MHLLSSNTDLLRFSIRAPHSTAMGASLAPDGRVLLFTLGLALFTGLAFGLAPAIKATRADLTPALKESAQFTFTGTGAGACGTCWSCRRWPGRWRYCC